VGCFESTGEEERNKMLNSAGTFSNKAWKGRWDDSRWMIGYCLK
jgi:hypothetical protein